MFATHLHYDAILHALTASGVIAIDPRHAMSVVQENVCCVNTQIDRLQHQITRPEKLLYTDDAPSPHVRHLQDVIHSLSVTSKSQPLLPTSRLVDLLSEHNLSPLQGVTDSETDADNASDHLWLVAAKAAMQASGRVMHTLLDQTLQIQDEIYYWNEVLGSIWYSGLYAAQTSPVRLWHWSKDIYFVQDAHAGEMSFLSSVTARWIRFYHIARSSVRSLSEHPTHLNLSSPLWACRSEIRQKRDALLDMKDVHTCSLGILMGRWNIFQKKDFATSDSSRSQRRWQDMVYETVLTTEAILQLSTGSSNASNFEQRVLVAVEKDLTSIRTLSGSSPLEPIDLVQRLVRLLQAQLPRHKASISAFITDQGRPSRMTRYWLPVLTSALASSASLRFLLHRQDEIYQWIVNIGSTIIDFGSNWVIDPIQKLIGTIRHDEKSEIAIMSKNSLVADRASLERMVIDFVRDRPDSGGGNLSGEDAAAIASAVKEGDLTPVLKAYERDLRSPFVGTVRGDLVRALLIQIQKTKVDVEIAISGIDALLKSQELVFGFVGLTPGILVSYASMRWLVGSFGNRRGLRKGKSRHELRRGLRNIARVLTSAPLSDGMISHKDSGRLICEAEALFQQVKVLLGGLQYQEFREDLHDLLDVQGGADKQLRVVERMRWAYS